jgi:hypothetical protein
LAGFGRIGETEKMMNVDNRALSLYRAAGDRRGELEILLKIRHSFVGSEPQKVQTISIRHFHSSRGKVIGVRKLTLATIGFVSTV